MQIVPLPFDCFLSSFVACCCCNGCITAPITTTDARRAPINTYRVTKNNQQSSVNNINNNTTDPRTTTFTTSTLQSVNHGISSQSVNNVYDVMYCCVIDFSLSLSHSLTCIGPFSPAAFAFKRAIYDYKPPFERSNLSAYNCGVECAYNCG